MDDKALKARLHELAKDWPKHSAAMRDLLKAEGGMPRVVGLIPLPKPPAKAVKFKGSPIGDWQPSETERERAKMVWAAVGRPDLSVENEVAKFRAHHEERETLSPRWSQRWVTWYRNAPDMTPSSRANGRAPNGQKVRGTDTDGWFRRLEVFYGLDQDPDEDQPGFSVGYWPTTWGDRRAVPDPAWELFIACHGKRMPWEQDIPAHLRT